MKNNKKEISVVLATFNEEENLGECLKSVEGLADEIIVVDGSSKDKTVDIAKKYGAKVVVTDNPPIFHINKQKAIDMATKDWILQLDADERVSPKLKNEIVDIIQNGKCPPASLDAMHLRTGKMENGKSIDGYWIPRKNWFLGRFLMKGGQYPDFTLRLYRRGKGRLPAKNVHEQAVVDGEVGYLKNPLIHIADPTFSRYLKRFNRYTDLIADELKDNKKKSIFTPLNYMVISPIYWFILTYGRHKGFMDLWSGFIFSFFSSLRFPVSYIKYIKRVGTGKPS